MKVFFIFLNDTFLLFAIRKGVFCEFVATLHKNIDFYLEKLYDNSAKGDEAIPVLLKTFCN